MAKATKNTYSTIQDELEWLENRAEEIKQYVDSNPYHLMKDRMRDVITKYGPGQLVVQTVEQQQKAIRESLKDYASLLEVIGKLREKEQAKLQVRGDGNISFLAKDFTNK